MVGVHTHTQVEVILADDLGHVLVHDDTSSFQRFGRELFLLTRAQVHAQREVVDGGILSANIVDTNLGVCGNRRSHAAQYERQAKTRAARDESESKRDARKRNE